ncbi:MAG: hypothetical protein EP338_14370 [Bacteroidetes bacterium]|nr:MAG: hypothetical protein EP338_14370 [Bacteroidota bacterium]
MNKILILLSLLCWAHGRAQTEKELNDLYDFADVVVHIHLEPDALDSMIVFTLESGTNSLGIKYSIIETIVDHREEKSGTAEREDRFWFSYGYLPLADSVLKAGEDYLAFFNVASNGSLYLERNAYLKYDQQVKVDLKNLVIDRKEKQIAFRRHWVEQLGMPYALDEEKKKELSEELTLFRALEVELRDDSTSSYLDALTRIAFEVPPIEEAHRYFLKKRSVACLLFLSFGATGKDAQMASETLLTLAMASRKIKFSREGQREFYRKQRLIKQVCISRLQFMSWETEMDTLSQKKLLQLIQMMNVLAFGSYDPQKTLSDYSAEKATLLLDWNRRIQ